jgi:hypothetical protein
MNGEQNSFQAAPAKMERRRLDIHDGRYRLPVEIIEPHVRSMGATGPILVFLHEGLGSIAQFMSAAAMETPIRWTPHAPSGISMKKPCRAFRKSCGSCRSTTPS